MCVHPGLQLCGIYYCGVKETNLEASELQRFYDGLSLKVKEHNINIILIYPE